MQTSETVTEFDGGPAVQPEFKNLYEAFQATVARKGDGLAIKSEEEEVELSWNDLDRRVRAIAGGLNALGVRRGDRVGMLLGPRSDFIPIDLAAVSIGALPFSMETKNNSSISPTLGTGALDTMIKAGALAFGLICIFLLVVYRLPGFVACLALLLQVAGMLLALSLPQITLTLPGIAGVILSIGMGVDANVIISERINEEMRKGKRLRSAIDTGFQQAFSSVFDGNITVMIVSVILMILGSGAMLSFAYSLLAGVILNFVAGVACSRFMIRSLSLFPALQKPSWFMKGRKVTA